MYVPVLACLSHPLLIRVQLCIIVGVALLIVLALLIRIRLCSTQSVQARVQVRMELLVIVASIDILEPGVVEGELRHGWARALPPAPGERNVRLGSGRSNVFAVEGVVDGIVDVGDGVVGLGVDGVVDEVVGKRVGLSGSERKTRSHIGGGRVRYGILGVFEGWDTRRGKVWARRLAHVEVLQPVAIEVELVDNLLHGTELLDGVGVLALESRQGGLEIRLRGRAILKGF